MGSLKALLSLRAADTLSLTAAVMLPQVLHKY